MVRLKLFQSLMVEGINELLVNESLQYGRIISFPFLNVDILSYFEYMVVSNYRDNMANYHFGCYKIAGVYVSFYESLRFPSQFPYK